MLSKIIKKSAQEMVFIPSKNSARWQPGKVRNDLLVNRPTVIFMTVVPPVDRPIDLAWKQRAMALCRSTARSTRTGYREQQLSAGRPGPFPYSRALWTVDRQVDRSTSSWLRARLCKSVDRTGRPTSATVDRPVDRQTARSNYYRD